jgi:hypothetical protein
MGPGTAVNTAMQPNGQKVLAPAAFEPASGTKLEDELRVVGLDERACGGSGLNFRRLLFIGLLLAVPRPVSHKPTGCRPVQSRS